jgi:hypothetical protein
VLFGAIRHREQGYRRSPRLGNRSIHGFLLSIRRDDGRVFGVVREGTLTHNIADCSVDRVWVAGTPVTEPSGSNHLHIGRNLGPAPVVLWVDYIQPAGTPLSVDVPEPGCGFA